MISELASKFKEAFKSASNFKRVFLEMVFSKSVDITHKWIKLLFSNLNTSFSNIFFLADKYFSVHKQLEAKISTKNRIPFRDTKKKFGLCLE